MVSAIYHDDKFVYTDADGKRVYRKQQVGDLSQYPNETAAKAAMDALRLTINNQSQRNGASQMTVQSLWDHYSSEKLPFKGLLHAGRIHFLLQELDSPAVESCFIPESKNGRCRVLVASSDGFKRHKDQDQVRHVGSVLTCCSLGVHFDKSDLVRDTGGSGRKARSQHRGSRERKAAKSANGFIVGTGQTRSHHT